MANCTILRRGDGKGFLCTYCGAGFMLGPDNKCWETQERFDVLDNVRKQEELL